MQAYGQATMAPGPARRVATAAVLLGLVVSAFEGTVVTSAMPTITRDLGGRDLYSWVFSAFLMASTLGVLVCGRLADQFGRRPVFVGGMVTFLLGSALCGLSHSMGALIAFRVLQGFGAGALQPVTTTISADIYTLRERATVQTVITGAWGGANVLGPVIGGWIVMHTTWRWVFLVNLPVGAAAVLLLLVSYRDPPRARARTTFSIAGPLLAGTTVALTLLALEPGAVHGAQRLWLGLVAAIGLVFFLWHQRSTAHPVFPAHLLKDRTVASGLIGGFFVGGLLYTASAYLPLYVTESAHGTPLAAGFAVVPVLVGWAVGSSVGVHVMIRGGLRASLGGGLVIAFLGVSLLAGTIDLHASLVVVGLAAAVLGLGLGPAGSTSTLGPQTRVDWHERAHVTSTIFASRMLGGSLAVGVIDFARGHFAEQFLLMAGMAGVAAVVLLSLAPGPEALGRHEASEPMRSAA